MFGISSAEDTKSRDGKGDDVARNNALFNDAARKATKKNLIIAANPQEGSLVLRIATRELMSQRLLFGSR